MRTIDSVRSKPLVVGAILGVGLAVGLGWVARVDRDHDAPSATRAPVSLDVPATRAFDDVSNDVAVGVSDSVSVGVSDSVPVGVPTSGVRVRPAGEGGLFVLTGAPLPPDAVPVAFDDAPAPTIAIDWGAVDWDAGYADPVWFGSVAD